jgi:histidinol-phosphate aminotransferase
MVAMLTRASDPVGEPDRWRYLTRERLARSLGLPADWVVIGESIEALLAAVLDAHPRDGPVLTFEPTALTAVPLVTEGGRVVTSWPRSHRFAVELTATEARLLPGNAVALLMSPNDPTGTVTSIQDVVRLARGCSLVAVDERYADPQAPSVLPLVREFENIVVLRLIGAWCDWGGPAPAYAVARPGVAERIRRAQGAESDLAPMLRTLSVLEDVVYDAAVLAYVRREKSRLFRMLRKLNMVRPLPSWAPFVAVRVERGTASFIAERLAETGILVHRPDDPCLPNHLRIGACSQEATETLKRALIAIARDL